MDGPFGYKWEIDRNPHGVWAMTILDNISLYAEELRSDLGEFTLAPNVGEPDFAYEVILTAENGDLFRCYMSDHNVDARLVVDDYVPSFHGGIPEAPFA